MNKLEEVIKNKIKEKVRTEQEIDKLARELADSNEVEDLMVESRSVKLTENQMFDALELCSFGILQNLRRKQCIDILEQYFEEIGIVVGPKPGNISVTRLISIYKSARNQLLSRNVQEVEKERDSYVKNMHRLALKAESVMDFATASKCYKDLAQVTGVFEREESSKIVLNFLPAPTKKD